MQNKSAPRGENEQGRRTHRGLRRALTVLALVAGASACKGKSAPVSEPVEPKSQASKVAGKQASTPPATPATGKETQASAASDAVQKPYQLVGANKKFPNQRDFKLPRPLFSPDSAWNQSAVEAKVLPGSDRQILAAYRAMRRLNPDWASADVSHKSYAVAIYRAGDKKGPVLLCNYGGEKDWGTNAKIGADKGATIQVPQPATFAHAPLPKGADSDGHLVLYQPKTHQEWDFWQATLQRKRKCKSKGGGLRGDKVLEAGFVDFFDVKGTGSNHPKRFSSARAMGVALLAGLLVPEDVEEGKIRHAMSFAITKPRNMNKAQPDKPRDSDIFYPAAYLETDHFQANPQMLAAGQRIRLKKKLVDADGDPIDESKLAPITRMFFAALREYGAYLVDNAGSFTFYAEDIHSARLDVSDAEVNRLIGKPVGTPLPKGKSKWAIVIGHLDNDMGKLPIAYGAFTKGQDASKARYRSANFEVVEPAKLPK